MNSLIGRAIFKYAFDRGTEHPGILHYLIQSYDIPNIDVAVQKLAYASRYNEIVLGASHAQNMPAHIYTRIGAFILELIE